MKKKYIKPSVKVYSVSTGRMVCGSDTETDALGLFGSQGEGYKHYGAWSKEDNEDFGW